MPLIKIEHQNNYVEEIPRIIFLLTTYFENKPQHFASEGLFRVNGERSRIEELSIYLTMGDFSIL